MQQHAQQVDPAQLRTSLQLAESEIKLHEFKLATFNERATKERGFIAALARKMLEGDTATNVIIGDYLRAHKAATDAEANIIQLEIAKIKGRAALMQATIEKMEAPAAEHIIRPAAPGRLVVPGAR